MAQKRSADTTITSWSYKKPCLVTSEIDECLRPDADICKTMVLNAHKKAGQECHDHGAYLKVRVPGTENYVAFFFDFELRKEFNSKNFDEVCSTYGVVDIIWANTWKNIKELPKSYYLKCKGNLKELCCPVFYGAHQASPMNPQVPNRYTQKLEDKEFELVILD